MPTDERQRFLGELAPSQHIDSRKRSDGAPRDLAAEEHGGPADPDAYQKKTGEIKKHPLDD